MKKTLRTTFDIKQVDSAMRTICGYAAIHNNVDRVRDTITPQASTNAVARLRSPQDVGVFIAHDTNNLPVGIPTKITADERGLYTETYVFPGPAGDNLLAVAQGLQKFGKSLGMSIGYRVMAAEPEYVDGRPVKKLTDYELGEYSFAAPQVIANPEALVVSVKTIGGMMYELKVVDGKHCLYQGDTLISEHDSAEDAVKALGVLYAGKAMNGVPEAMQRDEQKAEWSTAYVNDLPDSAFLYVEAGEKDDEGRTVPRSKRHFPVKGSDGSADAAHVRNAIARIPQSNAPGLDDSKKRSLQARARRMLEDMSGGKTASDIDRDEWKTGIPLDLRAIGYALLDLSEEAVAKQDAMTTLGQDHKTRARVPVEVRDAARGLIDRLSDLVKTAEEADRDDDPRAEVEWWERWVVFNAPAVDVA